MVPSHTLPADAGAKGDGGDGGVGDDAGGGGEGSGGHVFPGFLQGSHQMNGPEATSPAISNLVDLIFSKSGCSSVCLWV